MATVMPEVGGSRWRLVTWPYVLLAIPMLCMIVGTGLDFRLIGDEGRYHLKAIEIFATRPLAEAVADYPSASTPLPYFLFANFGHVFGFEVWRLRLFNVLISYVAVMLFFRLARRQGLPYPLVSSVLFLFMPYIFFFGFTVYTVSFGLLFGVWALHYYLLQEPRERDLLWGGILATMAIYSRQYYLMLPVGMLLSEFRHVRWNDLRGTIVRRYRRWALLVLPLVAFAPLVVMWKGLTPPQLQQGHFVHPVLKHVNFLPIFVGFYFLPALIDGRTGGLWGKRRFAFLALALLVPLYFAFPVVYSETASEIGAAGGIIAHGFDIVGERVGRTAEIAGWFGVWLIGTWIILAEISRRPWDQTKTTMVGLMIAFIALLTLTPYVYERYYTASVPILIVLLYRTARRPMVLWAWSVFLVGVSVIYSYYQIRLKSMEGWGVINQDWFHVIKDLPG